MFNTPAKLVTWDFWTITGKDGMHHAFFLQASRNRLNHETRHNVAEVGHAVSRDLETWEYRGTVLHRGLPGTWNDVAIWTGSVFETRMGDYGMLLTGRSSKEGGDEQRLGIFFSGDLYNWKPYDGNPVVECDFSIYERHHHTELTTTWRDPHVIWDEKVGVYRAFLTAQKKNSKGETIGVIAQAQSVSLTEWKVLEPVTTPPVFRVMECPQVVQDGNRWLMLVHIDKRWVMPDAPAEIPRTTGSHYLIADKIDGPYRYGGLLLDGGIDIEPRGHSWARYQLRVHDRDAKGNLRALYWNGYRKDASFVGGLDAPVILTPDKLKG